MTSAIKIRILSLVFLSTIFSPLSYATKVISNDLMTGWGAIQQKKLRSDLDYLTADQLEGRLASTKGDEKTIEWLVTQFKSTGLKPGNGNSYLQTFNVIEYVPDLKNSYITLERNGKKQKWAKPDIVTEFHQDLNLNAEIVFAGYGITAPALNYDDYENLDVKGKLVLVFEHEPQEKVATSVFNGTGNTPYATTRVKALNAEEHGAIGILIAPEPTRTHPSNQERYAKIGGRKQEIPSMVLEDSQIKIPVVVLSDKVAKQIAGKLNLAHLQRDIDINLQSQSRLIPDANVALQEKNTSRKIMQTSNVVGLLEGSDPTLMTETIIISAHHDHDGRSGKEIWHGADDNASGTAGVVTLAKALALNTKTESGLKPKRSILFSIFAAEERGLLGSYYMTMHPLRPLATTRAVINFDMIGRDEKRSPQTDGLITIPKDTDNRLNLIGAHYSPDYAKVVTAQNQYVKLTLDDRFDSENALNTFFRSDQFPFVLNKIPAFWWFTGFHSDYHHTTDTAEKIDYAKMQKILRLAYLSTYQFANTNEPPKFIEYP